MDVRFLGHAAFELSDGDTRVLIDPFLTGNPKAAVSADDLSASAILLILSESAVVSPHVGKEVERGSSKRRPILALRIDAAPLTPALEYFLSESQWIDARSGDLGALLARLNEAVRRLVASPVAVPPPSGEKNTDC